MFIIQHSKYKFHLIQYNTAMYVEAKIYVTAYYTIYRWSGIFYVKNKFKKNVRVDKFSQFSSILEIFLRKVFYLRVKFLRLVSTVKLL